MERIKRLLGLKREEEENLKKEIETSKGKGFVLVHPFDDTENTGGFRITDEYRERLNALFRRKEPLIILEEPKDLRYTIMEIRRMNPAKGIYIVPTDLPYVVLKDWNPLIEKLKELHIKQIHLGGRYTGFASSSDTHNKTLAAESDYSRTIRTLKEYEEKWLPERLKKLGTVPANHCVGETYYQLVNSKAFKVKLMPNLCSPGKRPKA